MVGGFLGSDVSLTQYSKLNVDMGPYWIRLEDDYTRLREKDIEFVLNFGISFYL